jgi:hypothetical protein
MLPTKCWYEVLITEDYSGGGISLSCAQNIVTGFTDDAFERGRVVTHGNVLIHCDIITTHASAAECSHYLSVSNTI